jgi:hypothetical protein
LSIPQYAARLREVLANPSLLPTLPTTTSTTTTLKRVLYTQTGDEDSWLTSCFHRHQHACSGTSALCSALCSQLSALSSLLSALCSHLCSHLSALCSHLCSHLCVRLCSPIDQELSQLYNLIEVTTFSPRRQSVLRRMHVGQVPSSCVCMHVCVPTRPLPPTTNRM